MKYTRFVLGLSLWLAACTADQEYATSETEQAVTATTQTTSIPFHLATAKPINLGGFSTAGADSSTSAPITFEITAQAAWNATVNTDVSWDSDKVRQGATLVLNRDVSSITGTMSVLWSVSGTLHLPEPAGNVGFGPLPIAIDSVSCVPDLTPTPSAPVGGDAAVGSGGTGGGPGADEHIAFSPCGTSGDSGACFGIIDDDGSVDGAGGTSMPTDNAAFLAHLMALEAQQEAEKKQLGNLGGQYISGSAQIDPTLTHFDCTASGEVTVWKTPGLFGSPYFKLKMVAGFKIVHQKATTSSQFLISDTQVGGGAIDLTPAPASDTLAMPCSYPPNADVQYALGAVDWKPATFLAAQQAFLVVGFMDPGYAFGLSELPPVFNAPVTPQIREALKVDLTAAGTTLDLGPLKANNVLPTVTAGPFSGVEGQPVPLSETASSACPITSYAWTFSNGSHAFGPSPSPTFGPHGQYSGELVVTDATHLSQSADFNVSIANAPPVALAGPSTSGAWGTQIALVGQGSDPGGDPLTYAWNFGDGTQGVGGTTAQHSYAIPGDYVATFTTCDDLNVCASSATPVHVRTRRTAVAFTGTNTGVYSAQAPLSGAIVDELGQPVVGGPLAFTLGGNAAGAAQTDSTGIGTTMQTIGVPAGSYLTTATFPGNMFYAGGSTSSSFLVTLMGSSVQYTGATTSNANKSTTLSAKLADALGRPLGGKTVVFQLGSQQAQAVTDITGIASTTLMLSQRNGTYPLSTTWTPAGADAGKWSGASTAGAFKIGNK